MSLFSGIGGLEAGIEGKCVGFSEIRESAIRVYRAHYPGVENMGDVTKIVPEEIPDFDMLVGGFPCQSFSLAGLRKGFNDPRGVMILYMRNIMLAKRPQWAVFENVKGLLSHDGGATYMKVFKVLQSAGYRMRVVLLNSLYYGSAQNRERLFFLCSREEFSVERPLIKDDSKRFLDVVDEDGPFREISRTERNVDKIEQRGQFKFELIGPYDRVGALTTQFGCGRKAVADGDWFRYLTVGECERLQGFPGGWTEGVREAERYFVLGNAVNCDVSKYLFREYLDELWW